MVDYPYADFDFESIPKLIRDFIPEIIQKKEGAVALTEVLNSSDFVYYLKRKLVEEALETMNTDHTNRIEFMREIADILEVLEALQKELNLSEDEILTQKQLKKAKNGGFEKKLLLKGTV